jgi:hypothetical protein
MIKTEIEDIILTKLAHKREILNSDLFNNKISKNVYLILVRRINSKEISRRVFLLKGDTNEHT